MARKAIYNYIYSPGATTVGKVIIPDPYKLGDILMITNVTRNTVIYNFGDPSRGGTLTYTNGTNVTDSAPSGGGFTGTLSASQLIFQNLNNGYSTINLTFDTSGHSATDVLQIYVETGELKVRPYDFGVDAVERMKIASPQSLIDADFEYGMQPTKWVQFATMNDMPTVFEMPGSDLIPTVGSYATFIGGGGASASTWIASPAQTNILVHNQGFDGGGQLTQAGPRAITNGYYLVIAQGQAGQPNCAAGTTFITSQQPVRVETGGMYQRTFTVGNTAGWAPGDIACVVEMPGEGAQGGAYGVAGAAVFATVLAGGTLTAGNTTLNANTTIAANSIVMVETSQFGVWEAMQISGAAGTTQGTGVVRNLWGTNAANAQILAGAKIRVLSGVTTGFSNSNVETMRVDSVDSLNQFTVTRSWFNVNASPTFGANSIVFKVNHSANSAIAQNSANIEIVRTTVANPINLSGNPGQAIERGRLGTAPLSAAGPGSLFIPLTGVFYSGNVSVPSVSMYIPSHGIGVFSNTNIANCYISTIGISQAVTVSNIEGVYINQINDANYIKYHPKTGINQLPGHMLNINDTQTIVRRGGIYTGANIVVANVTSNVGSPSGITVNTVYPHGLTPGQAVQVQLYSGAQSTGQFANIYEGASGQFVIQSTPTDKSFVYVTRPNIVVPALNTTGAINSGGQLFANITIFPTGLVKHRPFDGGNNIGTNTPAHGYEMTRQTKKYFRYQSGKGTMFTSGTQFMPTFQVANVVAAGTTLGSAITITTENEHGLQIGANVNLYGISTSGYNTFYRVATITNSNQFTVLATGALGAAVPSWTRTNIGNSEYAGQSFPRVTVVNWHGSRVRSGIFDDSNGVFFEYDGNQFYAVKRSSTNDLGGRINVQIGSNFVIGDANTRFLDQLATGDQILIKGMTHTIGKIVDQNHMYILPTYRGVVNAQDARIVRVGEERTAQKFFNMDRADGTGPSGYVMNLAKMQMIGIQYTWYGAGFVDYMVRAIDGKMVFLHRSKGNNINDEAYMRTGNLPARYQAVNKGPRTWTSKAVAVDATEIQLYNVSEFPTANAAYPVTVQIDNELIKYTGVWTANGNITGLTRGATLSNYVLNQSQNLYQGSNTGTAWIDNGMPVGDRNWADVAFNPVAGVWVAIAGYGSATNSTAYSFDGHTWTTGGNLPVSSTWISIAYGQLNGVDTFVAVSNTSGTISAYSQDNGVTWTTLTLSATAQWSGVSYGADQNNVPVFVAIAGANSASTATAYLKVIGTGWVAGGALPASQMWTSIAFGQTSANTAPGGNALSSRANYFYAVGCGAALTTATAISAYSTDGGVTWFQGAVQSGTWVSVAFGNNTWMAVAGGLGSTAGTAGCYIHGNPAVATWAAMTLPASSQWRCIIWGPMYSMSQSATPNIGIAGQWFIVSDSVAATAAQCTNPHVLGPGVTPTWITVTMPVTAALTSVAWGKGTFVCVGINTWQVQLSNYANTFVSTDLVLSGNTQAMAFGYGNIVSVAAGTTATGISYNGGRQWQAGAAMASSSNWIDVAYGPAIGRDAQGRFVAISTTNGTINNWQDANNLGTTWIAGGALPATANWSSICYVNGAFVAVGAGTQVSAFSANGAIGWGGVNLPSSSTWIGVAGGLFPAFAGNTGNVYCVAAVSGASGTIAAFSNVRAAISGSVTAPDIGNEGRSLVSLWGTATLPATATWSAIEYGFDTVNNVGRFVAIASGSQSSAWSTDGGRTWTLGGNLPSSSNWYRIKFATANNTWVAISNSRDTKAAYSRDGGVTWVATTLPIATNWTALAYDPQRTQFVAGSGDGTNASSNVALSLTTAGIGQTHTANTGVKVVSVTASPDLNHWGSAIIMDGGFTVDRTYTFTYNVSNYNIVASAGVAQTMFMMRLAPTISNSLTGELGAKELINRAQVLLQSMYINVGSPAGRYLVQGLLNPTNVVNANWRPLNQAANFLQPSFTQFVANGLAASTATVRQIEFGATATVGQGINSLAASGGEQLFSIPVTQTNSGFLDLSQIKEITSMVLPGQGTYPNGNEILAINIVPITAVASNVDIQLTFIESQA